MINILQDYDDFMTIDSFLHILLAKNEHVNVLRQANSL